jgi:hypothetical protein
MEQLTRDQILSAPDLKKERVEVPEWGGFVWVRGLTALERDRYDESLLKRVKGRRLIDATGARAKLVALTVTNEAGQRIFSDADVEALNAKSAAPIDRLFTVAQRLSAVTEEQIEDLVKNSESDQSEG